MEDLKTERAEKAKLFIKLVQEATIHPIYANSPYSCHLIACLQGIINDFKALDKDQKEHHSVLMGKLIALRKEREDLKNDS